MFTEQAMQNALFVFRVYKKTKSGDVCYRDHEIAHTPLNQPIYPYSFSN